MDIYGNLDREDMGWGKEPDPAPYLLGVFLAVLVILLIDLFIR